MVEEVRSGVFFVADDILKVQDMKDPRK